MQKEPWHHEREPANVGKAARLTVTNTLLRLQGSVWWEGNAYHRERHTRAFWVFDKSRLLTESFSINKTITIPRFHCTITFFIVNECSQLPLHRDSSPWIYDDSLQIQWRGQLQLGLPGASEVVLPLGSHTELEFAFFLLVSAVKPGGCVFFFFCCSRCSCLWSTENGTQCWVWWPTPVIPGEKKGEQWV